MQYFSPELSKKLSEIGCVPIRDEMFWYDKKTEPHEPFLSIYTSDWAPTHNRWNAFLPSDFLASEHARDNLIKVFGFYLGSIVFDGVSGRLEFNIAESGSDSTDEISFKFHAHRLLDIVISKGDVESYISKYLDEVKANP